MSQNLLADMDIKNNIKALRKKSGLSQALVAAKLQTMGINTVSNQKYGAF